MKKIFSIVLLVTVILFSFDTYMSSDNLEAYHNLTAPMKFEASEDELNSLDKNMLVKLVTTLSIDQNQHSEARDKAVETYNRLLIMFSVVGLFSAGLCVFCAWSKNA